VCCPRRQSCIRPVGAFARRRRPPPPNFSCDARTPASKSAAIAQSPRFEADRHGFSHPRAAGRSGHAAVVRRNMPVLHRSRGSRPTHSRAAPANSPRCCRGVCISAPVSASAQSRRREADVAPGPASSQGVPPPVEEPRAGRCLISFSSAGRAGRRANSDSPSALSVRGAQQVGSSCRTRTGAISIDLRDTGDRRRRRNLVVVVRRHHQRGEPCVTPADRSDDVRALQHEGGSGKSRSARAAILSIEAIQDASRRSTAPPSRGL